MKQLLVILLVLGTSTITIAQTHYGNNAGTQGTGHSFFGEQAGRNNTGAHNSFFGHYAGKNNSIGFSNSFFGAFTGLDNTSGRYNTFAGRTAGGSNTTGSFNTFLGGNSGLGNTTGSQNTFLGHRAGNSNQTGNNNTYIGVQVAHNNVSGSYNTMIGYHSGRNNTGSSNVFVGYEAGRNETSSNQLYIHNSSAATPLIYGDFAAGGVGIGTKKLVDANDNAFYTLSVNGKVRTTELRVYPGWADYVFEPGYKLRSLPEVEKHIQQHKHLPDVPSAKEVTKNGILVGDMEATLLRKIEELTLYMITANKSNELLQKEVSQVGQRLQGIEQEVQAVKTTQRSLKKKIK